MEGVAPGSAFLIQPSGDLTLCLAPRDAKAGDAADADPRVVLSTVAADPSRQTWRLVRGVSLQHVASGRFLHAEHRFASVRSQQKPWEGNHSELVTRAEEAGSDAQTWALGQQGEHLACGGRALRHYRDGRAVDAGRGRPLRDGNEAGVEHSAYVENRGVAFVLTARP